MDVDEALRGLDKINIISKPLNPSNVETVLDVVSNKMETLKMEEVREKIKEIEELRKNQGLDTPYEEIEVPEDVKLTTQISDLMYNFVRLPDHWVSENSGMLSDAIQFLNNKIAARFFPETQIVATVKELEVVVFSLLFGLSIDLSEKIYPIYQTLYLANEYTIESYKINGLDENSISFDVLKHFLEESNTEKNQRKIKGDVLEHIKILTYRILLERLGNVSLPSKAEPGALKVSKDLLMKLIPTSLLIEYGILAKGAEVQEGDTFPFLTNFEKARLVGERTIEIAEGNADAMVDVGPLTDAMQIAEKELEELVIPLKVCRRYPDGSERIWCASSLAKARDDFYDFIKEDLDKISLEGLYQIAIENGLTREVKDLMLTFISGDLGLEVEMEVMELRPLRGKEIDSFIKDVKDLLEKSGLNIEDINEPLSILRLLVPIMKVYPTLTRLLTVDVCSNFFDIYSNTEWVNIPGSAQTDPSDRPRRLTRDEIDDILTSLPEVRSALKSLSIQARKSMQDKMRSTLEEIKICPSGISELKQTIVIQFNKSQIDPGSAVGINAADALGEQVSQMTMNSFHSVGSNKNMSSGIRALSELIYAMKTRKNNNCVVVFKERLSFDDMLKKESDIVQTNVGQLVKDYTVNHPANLNTEDYWWYSYFTDLPVIEDETRILRLYLDSTLMVERKVTMADVVHALEKGQNKDGIPPHSLYFVHSPTNEGIIDIYPDPRLINQSIGKIEDTIDAGTLTRTANRGRYRPSVFLNNIILANLDFIHIRGVLDISQIYVTKAPVLEILEKEYRVSLDERSRYDLPSGEMYWRILYDMNILAYSPIKPVMLLELLDFTGYEIVVSEPKGCIVKYIGPEEGSSDDSLKMNQKPSFVVKDSIDKAEKVEKREERTETQNRLIYLTYYNTLNTNGSNLFGLMEKMDVDMFYTYSNNIHLMKEVYGVEAARQFFIKELYDTFTVQGGYVNSRNISLLADFLFRYGSFLGTNYTGMKAGTMGYFSLATFERSLEVLVRSAIFSETETLEGVSAAIAVGKPVTIGTGFFNVISDHASNAIKAKELAEERRISDAEAITLAMGGGACPNKFSDERNDSSFRDDFFSVEEYSGGVERENGATTEPQTEEVTIQMADEPTECPPGDIVQPSRMLEEAMEDLPFDREVPDITSEELKVRIIEIPSGVKQRSLRTSEPTVTVPEGTSLNEDEEEELLDMREEGPRLTFTDIPVIQIGK